MEYHAQLEIQQHEDDDLDYPVDFSSWIPSGSVISSHVVSLQAGLTLGTNSHTDDSVLFWVSGGTAGTQYAAEVKITLDTGQIYVITFSFSIVDVLTV
jgi:hypothetical protein